MKFHKQRQLVIPGEDKHPRGSCYPTVYACLLDMELDDVPHFNLFYWSEESDTGVFIIHEKGSKLDHPSYRDDLGTFLNLWDIVRYQWLASQGYIETTIDNIEEWLQDNKGVPYLAFGRSSRNVGHVVIYQDGEMIHDPHPSGEGLTELDTNRAFRYLKKYETRGEERGTEA